MGTRAAAFTAKIKSMREAQHKVSGGVVPAPTGTDLANCYRWFSSTLLTILKDVPGLPYHMIRNREMDSERLELYPRLDYKELYDCLYEFIPDLRLVSTSLYSCGKAMLTLLAALFPFMERNTIEDFPYNITELIDVLPMSLCHEAVDVLCDHLLPFILATTPQAVPTTACNDYVPAMIQTTLQKSPYDTAVHRKLIECVMGHKADVHFDLLHVVAYGPTVAKVPAANILFFYWPILNPNPAERKDIAVKFSVENTWIAPVCSNINCSAAEPVEATKVCLDHAIPLTQRGDLPPPAFFCGDCADKFSLTRPKGEQQIFEDINLPISQMELLCGNEHCRSQDKRTVCTCFSPECTIYNCHRPIGYCQQCYGIRHNARRGQHHVLQKPIISPWKMTADEKEVFQASIISLLSLARAFGSEQGEENHRRTMTLLDDAVDDEEDFTYDDYLMASRYGVWLLVGLCQPGPDEEGDALMGLLSMLFEWYKVTATLPNDKSGAKVEKIKSDLIPPWLKLLFGHSPHLFVQCLIPQPKKEAKVGGHWEVSAPSTVVIKEGLTRLSCLLSFDIITLGLWTEIAPHWIETIVQHYPRDQLGELASLFCKIFDPDMSPLGFELDEMYGFVTARMSCREPVDQWQVVGWLQTLCHLGVIIPLDTLFSMYSVGISSLAPGPAPTEADTVRCLQIFSRMIDVFIVQLKLQDIEERLGMLGQFSPQTVSLALSMLSAPWLELALRASNSSDSSPGEEGGGHHTEVGENVFVFCQLLRNCLRHMLLEDGVEEEDMDGVQNTLSTANTLINEDKKDTIKGRTPGLGGFMAVLSNTFKTTVEKVQEDMSDSTEEDEQDYDELIREPHYDLSGLPSHVQLLARLFLATHCLHKPEITFYTLDALKSLALNEEVLFETCRRHRRLFIWLQYNHIMPDMWRELDASHSQVATIAVPILLHSITLAHGSDIMWRTLDRDFHSPDWKVRFTAVEKTTLIFRFLTDGPVKKSQTLRSCLSHAFCHLIAAMDDSSPQVSQRATIYLGTIHDRAVQSLLWCLDCQFDMVPVDRPYILKSLLQLFNTLDERKILTWEFFANRFDFVIQEIQESSKAPVKEEQDNGHCPRERPGTGVQTKTRERSGDTVRSLAASMRKDYMRTLSAPPGSLSGLRSGGLARQMTVQEDGDFKRQQSAPLPVPKHKLSKPGPEAPLRLVSQTGEEQDYKDVAPKSMELEQSDKEMLHLVVFLFMQFLSSPGQAEIPENKDSSAYLGMKRSLHGLFSLLGYDEKEQRFTTMPHKIRTTPQFCSFFANLAQVMDNNFPIGNLLIPNIVLILHKSPFPPRYAANWQPTYSILQENLHYAGCSYTLWHLEPSLRKLWLEAMLVLVYKYNFSEPENLSDKVIGLIRIIINSLAAHMHICSKYCKTEGSALQQVRSAQCSQELSEASNGNLGTATLQGSEDNSDFNSRTSPTSNKRVEDGISNNSDRGEEELVNCELETIFEGGVKPGSLAVGGKAAAGRGNNHENPLFFDLLPQGVAAMSPGWLPGDQSVTSAGLPTGWTMQLMDNGKVLYVDNIGGSTSWQDPRTGTQPRKRGPFFSSPPSPLSLMDVLTVGGSHPLPPCARRGEGGGRESSFSSSSTESAATVTEQQQHQRPPEERLLPIGGGGEPRRVAGSRAGLSLLDRVWQVLGSIEDSEDRQPLVEMELGAAQHVRVGCNLPPTEEREEEEREEQKPAARQRKLGVCRDPPVEVAAGGGVLEREEEPARATALPPGVTRQSQLRIGEDTVIDRCQTCGALTERYTDSELSLALVVTNTFVHRDPQLAAPLLPEILLVVARVAARPLYSWETEGNLTVIPGNPRSVARQFLRVTLQQLSSNGVFPLLFKIDLNDSQRKAFYSTIASCLNDFSDLSPTVPVQLFFENIESIHQSIDETLNTCLPNLICFLSFIQFDHHNWSAVFPGLEVFFRNLALTLNTDGKPEKVESLGRDMKLSNIGPIMKLAAFAMKMYYAKDHRSILEPVAKVIGFAIQFCTFQFQDLVDICSNCNKAFSKERDKSHVIRAVIAKFIEALKYKTSIPDVNFLYLGSMMLQDAKGELPPSSILEDVPRIELSLAGPIHTGSTPYLECYLPDIVEFVADVHTLSKVKSHVRGLTIGLNQDTLGGCLKAALSQFLALEIGHLSQDRSEQKITKYMPWLFNPPTTITSQGPKEFLECVSHIRLLSWLLLGALNHTLLVGSREGSWPCQPIPLEASCHIADHIEVILAGFAEQSKTSVVHMCSLFHAFILSQLWTVYLEQVQPSGNTKEELLLAPSILLDFWVKVTPGILQLVSHSKVLAEMVNLHFLSLMEALLECRSTILAKLMPLWCPVLHAYNTNLPDHIRVRLQSIHDSAPPAPRPQQDAQLNKNLLNWLHRLQFKMGQIELQASNATQQFFTV